MKTKYIIIALSFALFACAQHNKKLDKNNNLKGSALVQASSEDQVSVLKPVIPAMTISVGGSNADVRGFTSEAIQVAVEAVHSNGGGTVNLTSGIYNITAPVNLYSNVSLVGSGNSTILKKCKGFRSAFTIDADYGELQITVKDPSGFKPGMGVAVFDTTQMWGFAVTTAIIKSIEKNVLHIDNFLLRDYAASLGGTVTNACSVISAIDASNVRIANLSIDGSRETNDRIDGCRIAAVYLHKVKNSSVENVTVKNFNYDGISWQITEDVTVKNCEVSGCANAGLHPGTGSPRTIIEGNNCHDNDHYGLFICWRVRNAIVKDNHFHHNGLNGICNGHKDTGILFTGNHVEENGSDGINFRGETQDNAPNNCIFRNNLVENNGAKAGGYGFSFMSPAEGIVLENNVIRNNKDGKQIAAIAVYPKGISPTLKDNQISGHVKGELVLVK